MTGVSANARWETWRRIRWRGGKELPHGGVALDGGDVGLVDGQRSCHESEDQQGEQVAGPLRWGSSSMARGQWVGEGPPCAGSACVCRLPWCSGGHHAHNDLWLVLLILQPADAALSGGQG